MQNYYEILHVDPNADQETIQAAYEQMRARHDPEKLEGAADELVELARIKRDEIDHAYAVLSDPTRRAVYDEERDAVDAPLPPATDVDDSDLLDYRPLPPAGGQERPRDFDPQPTRRPSPAAKPAGRQAGQEQERPAWLVPVGVVAVTSFVIMLVSLLLTNGGYLRYAADTSAMQQAASSAQQTTPSPNPTAASQDIITQYDNQLTAARQVVQQVPDNPDAWVQLGNAFYDRVQVVREQGVQSPEYTRLLPLWLEASSAYSEALRLGINSAVVRSDMGVSLCYYGAGTGDQSYALRGLEQTRQAVESGTQNGRVLLNHGICLVSLQPPRTQEALGYWNQVLSLPATERGVAVQAQHLVDIYSP